MDKDKLIEKLKHIYIVNNTSVGYFPEKDVKLSAHEINLILTSLTAPVDGKEELFKDEIDSAIDKYSFRVPYDGTNKFYDEEAAKHYEAGIYWTLNRLTPKTPDAG